MNNPYMIGKHVYLRHPTEEDALGRWHEWFSDEETCKYLGDRFWPNSKEAQLDFLKSLENSNRLVLSVVTIEDDKHIGVVSLSQINWVHRYADPAIVIGEKEYKKGPYSLDAYSLILKIAFIRLNLRTVRSSRVKSNKASEHLTSLFNYTTVGEYKNLVCIDGKYDDIVVGMLDRESWLKRNPEYKQVSNESKI
jgi:RimJ/RimL family protein N-acetyltransferase